MEQPSSAKPERLVSIDALRGFDMFWIMGADSLFTALLAKVKHPWSERLAQQLDHVEWEGFRFYDLIFPLFLFLVGCVLPFSLEKYRDEPKRVYWRIGRRVVLLILLGLICNRLLDFRFEQMRYAGVLQRIGICYGAAALLWLHLRVRGQAIAWAAILLGYWGLLAFVATPGGIAGDYSKEGNLSGYIDRTYLPGVIMKEYYGYGDNEGILSTLPAVATALLGAFAGQWLKSAAIPSRKFLGLCVAGITCLLLGHLWSFCFPVVKNLWTSSFVLVAGGWSLLLLAGFYGVIDVLGWKRWSFVWVVIGANAIAIFIVPRFIDFNHMSKFFVGGLARLSGDWGGIVLLCGALACKWLMLWYFYRQRIFLRV